MAEIKPYCFEPMRGSSELEEGNVHKSRDKHQSGLINCGVYASVVWTEKGNKKKECLCCKDIKEVVNKLLCE